MLDASSLIFFFNVIKKISYITLLIALITSHRKDSDISYNRTLNI